MFQSVRIHLMSNFIQVFKFYILNISKRAKGARVNLKFMTFIKTYTTHMMGHIGILNINGIVLVVTYYKTQIALTKLFIITKYSIIILLFVNTRVYLLT